MVAGAGTVALSVLYVRTQQRPEGVLSPTPSLPLPTPTEESALTPVREAPARVFQFWGQTDITFSELIVTYEQITG